MTTATAATPTAIDVRSLSKSFGRKRVLEEIAFTIAPGERITLIGPSGSGKSTLLRHLVGLTAADRVGSRITLLERTVQSDGRLLSAPRRERCRVGYIFQNFNLVNRLSVLQNVLIGRLGRMPRWRALSARFSADEHRMAHEALARVGLHDLAAQRANTLSGGQMQRVAIARALVQEAEIILADEPIASLDPKSAREVMDILRRINEEDGRAVVVSLHQIDIARQWCDRAIALKRGRLYYDGPTRALTDQRLAALYDDAGLEELLAQPAPAGRQRLATAG
ncbi:phosphonate ABC transporter ATP-binding protein [Kushneria phosphatilytica]|uniref:Phosphonate ABC transporter ATP-binding protein n=1 Tax=Kushneria phosphatilytica TaxID=657387 RepID=A0A5C1A5C9_9GAMM|nr:phosphonate ABC transporter ATP-binding protein [Kushneria phosphatilytica]QEL12339.1 phosphonate ABC transporter ATP-binding protein [Kushneria phosphatilytica]